MGIKRTDRLNSLLREVIAEVIRLDVENQEIAPLHTITRVEITRDLRYAKVYVSVIGDDKSRESTLKALQSASGFIAVNSAKKVVMRYFPELTFILDTGVDKQMRIEEKLSEIEQERKSRAEMSDVEASE